MSEHLADAELNEYLDGALAAEQRAAAAGHLAQCLACRSRLAELQALFISLDGLPDLSLRRDLAPAVMQALPRGPAVGIRAAADPHRPYFYAIFAAQVLLAVALLSLAWPSVAGRLAGLIAPALSWQPRPADLLAAARVAPDFAAGLAGLYSLTQTLRSASAAAALGLPEPRAGVAGAALLWLLGHAWLLRRPLAAWIRRRS